jgi:uncharacterized membrane protein
MGFPTSADVNGFDEGHVKVVGAAVSSIIASLTIVGSMTRTVVARSMFSVVAKVFVRASVS